MDSHSFVIPRAAAHKRSLQDGGATVIKSGQTVTMRPLEYGQKRKG